MSEQDKIPESERALRAELASTIAELFRARQVIARQACVIGNMAPLLYRLTSEEAKRFAAPGPDSDDIQAAVSDAARRVARGLIVVCDGEELFAVTSLGELDLTWTKNAKKEEPRRYTGALRDDLIDK